MNVVVKNVPIDAVLNRQHSLSHDDPSGAFVQLRVMKDVLQQTLAGLRELHYEGEFSRMLKPVIKSYGVGAHGFLPHL